MLISLRLTVIVSVYDFANSIKRWKGLNENTEEDDNPDLAHYLGKYEIGMPYKWGQSEFTVLL
jgi:outer membrane phospholipase A